MLDSSMTSTPAFPTLAPSEPPSNASVIDNHNSIRTIGTRFLADAFGTGVANATTFVNTLIHEAVELKASDIFFEPQKTQILVRARIDGVMYVLGNFPLDYYPSIIARIKILSKLDSTEKRKTQEGQFSLDHESKTINLRVEIVQTIFDEMVVIRILQLSTVVRKLEALGFNPKAYTAFTDILAHRSGLILVAGPTGSGKTTTLYSTINHLNQKKEFNIMTIEDPVEYQLEGVNQMPVRHDLGFTFEAGLKAILRLSPDIVLVGEIRDQKTAMIAVESGLTGHMILSTIHTPDAVGVIYRLLDLGIESYFINASLKGVIAQRLVRQVCQSCKQPYEPSPDDLALANHYLGRPPQALYRSVGCPACQNLGYSGRLGIYEVIKVDAHIRSFIREKTPEDVVRQYLNNQGFISLTRDGLLKAEQGLTTIDEVMRQSLQID